MFNTHHFCGQLGALGNNTEGDVSINGLSVKHHLHQTQNAYLFFQQIGFRSQEGLHITSFC